MFWDLFHLIRYLIRAVVGSFLIGSMMKEVMRLIFICLGCLKGFLSVRLSLLVDLLSLVVVGLMLALVGLAVGLYVLVAVLAFVLCLVGQYHLPLVCVLLSECFACLRP